MTDFITFLCLRGVSQAGVTGTFVLLMTQQGRLRLADVTSANRAPQGDREYGLAEANGWASLVCPEPYESLAADLSRLLGCAAFLFHLHDGETWLYWFYEAGRELDRFDSVPEFWDEATTSEMTATLGKPGLLAQKLGVDAAAIAPYLSRASSQDIEVAEHYDVVDTALDLLDKDARVYPDDRFDVWDARVMYDFMRRLGITPPLDASGKPAAPITLLRFEPTV